MFNPYSVDPVQSGSNKISFKGLMPKSVNDDMPPTEPVQHTLSINNNPFSQAVIDPIGKEMMVLYNKNVPYDNKPASTLVKNAAQRVGVDPSLLFSSSFQEGFNRAIVKPNETSGAYSNAENGGYNNGDGLKGTQPKLDTKNYPIDGFYNYGLDTFADKFPELVRKGYLPKDFDFKAYKAFNEKNELVNTGAFRNNEDALTAKAAFLKDTSDRVTALAKQKGVQLDDKARNYFTLAEYNGGPRNAEKMLDEYAKAKDKNAFIDQGLTSRKGVHKNISPRLRNMYLASQLLK